MMWRKKSAEEETIKKEEIQVRKQGRVKMKW